jgi:protein-disulfide isomerase
MSSRVEQKAAARARREASVREEEARERRRRTLIQLGIALAAAAAIVVVLILVSQAGDDTGGPIEGGAESAELFAGIPQQGRFLGPPNAPVALVEFADLQCPACRQYSSDVVPSLVNDYVREGRLRMELRPIAILGPDSEVGARATLAAGRQDKMWEYADLLYRNQGIENTGYLTESFTRDVAAAVAGLDVERFTRDLGSAAVERDLARSQATAQAQGVNGTPTVLVGRRGESPTAVEVTAQAPDQYTAAIDRLLGQR